MTETEWEERMYDEIERRARQRRIERRWQTIDRYWLAIVAVTVVVLFFMR